MDSNPATKKRIRLKCRYENEIRIVIIAVDQRFDQLKKRLSNDYGFDVTLKYEDHEGDMITLASQNDLDVLFSEENETVNVTVTENLLPNVHGKKNMKVMTSLWSGNSSSDWSKISHPQHSHSPSPTTSSVPHLQPLRPISKLDRFPVIENSPRYMEKPTRWKKGEILGQGAFGIVFLGLNIETGELMAVKQMTLDDVTKKELSSLDNEINMLRSLRHPNIVRYIGTELTATTLSIFLEYVPGGSLKSLIDKFGKLEESVARSYTRQLLLGLEYLHRNGIAHRDVKGANCLVGNDGAIKLADFGASKHWRPQVAVDIDSQTEQAIQNSGSGSHEVRGTPSWMAPEVIRNDERHLNWKKADVWSLGCTTIEMTTGKSPWSQFTNPVTVLYHIACSDSLPEYPENPSVELLTFLNSCLQRDPLNRPDITSLLLHPFVANASYLASWNPVGGYGYRPSTVSTTPSMGEWDRESLSGTWKSNTMSRSLLGTNRGDLQLDPTILEREISSSSEIAPNSLSSLQSAGQRLSPRYNSNDNLYRQPPVGNPDLDLEATAPRAVIDNALKGMRQERETETLSPITTYEKYPTNDSHSLETSLEASDLEDSANTFESSRIVSQMSSDDESHPPPPPSSIPPHKVSTAASRRRARASHLSSFNSQDEDMPARIPEYTEEVTHRKSHNAIPLLQAKDEIIYSAESLATFNESEDKAKDFGERKKTLDSSREPSKKNKENRVKPKEKIRKQKLNPIAALPITSIISRNEDPLSPPRRTANVVSITSPNSLDSPKTSRKGIQSTNRLTVVGEDDRKRKESSEETKSPQKILRRPFEYTHGLSNNDPESSVRVITPDFSDSKNDNLMKSWKSDKSNSIQIEDEVDRQKELTDRLFSLRTDEIHDESEVYEDIENHSFSDDLPAAELSDDCEILENSVTHLSDDDIVDFTTEDYVMNGLPDSSDWIIGSQERNKHGPEKNSLESEEKGQHTVDKNSINFDEKIHHNQDQWAGTSTKAKKQGEGDSSHRPLTISPSMPSLDIHANSKLDGYALVGHSLQHTQTPKTDIRSHKQVAGMSKNSSAKQLLHRGGGTGGNSTFRRNLEISGDSIDLRLSGANTANATSRKPRDSIESSTIGEIPLGRGHYGVDEDSQLEDSLNLDGVPNLNPTADILEEHTSGISRLRLNSTKQLLFSASFDGTIRIWSANNTDPDSSRSKSIMDVATFASKIASSVAPSQTITKKPSSLSSSKGGITPTRPIRVTGMWVDDSCETIWGGYSDGAVRVWLSDSRPLRSLKGHEDLITCIEGCETLASSAIGSPQIVTTGSLDKTVRIWDLRAKRPQVSLFKGHSDSILSIKWIDFGRSIVSASKDRSIKLWDTRAGRLRVSIDKHFGSVNVIKALPFRSQQSDRDLPSFLSGSRDGMISSWAIDGNCLGSQGAHRNSVSCMSEIQSIDNCRDHSVLDHPNIITAGADNLVKVWDIKRLKSMTEFTAPNVVKVAWFHHRIITGTSTGTMTIWENSSNSSSSISGVNPTQTETQSGQWISRELTSHSQMCSDIVSNTYCVASASKSGQILRWSLL